VKHLIPTRQLALLSILAAMGATARIGLGWVALQAPQAAYGVLIKVGLTETVAFLSGLAFGPVQGFATGVLVIVVSDLFMMPGPWTPFIAAIIGLLGVGGGLLHVRRKNPSLVLLGASAVGLTLMSELLQNTWFALFFGIPVEAAVLTGIPSIVTALINNTFLFTTLVPRVLTILRQKRMLAPVENARAP